jgi:hypothetical protein
MPDPIASKNIPNAMNPNPYINSQSRVRRLFFLFNVISCSHFSYYRFVSLPTEFFFYVALLWLGKRKASHQKLRDQIQQHYMEYQPVPHKLHQDIHKLDKQRTMHVRKCYEKLA